MSNHIILSEESQKSTIKNKIIDTDPSAKDFKFELSAENISGNNIWYIEWKSKNLKSDESLCWASMDENNWIQLHDDGILAVKYISNILDKKRSLSQRIKEFSLLDLIAAFIAIVVTLAFVAQLLIKGALSQEMVAILGIILGYYFGKNIDKASS